MKNSEIERVAPVKLFQKSWLIWFLLGLVLTVGILPVHSGALRQSESLLPVQLVQQGKKHYDTEQFQKAVEDLQEAVKAFENRGDKLNQAITLSNLSLAYQQLGEFLEAETAIAKTWQLLGFKHSEGISAIPPQQLKILAPALNIHGRLEYIRGKPIEQFTEALQEQREVALHNLPPSRTKVYAQINLAHNRACLRQKLNLFNLSCIFLPTL
ncbi:MAG: tetratricopeptide repeat protein [Xenococcaceae cyanobacterium MO_188.B19]|nr:tetratricopeptide repeat protein [Xenococcaceae cyanobacterium MO_188.B19]